MIDKDRIKQLVDKYYALKEEGKLKDYNEEATKKGFIEPLFHALGWDIENLNEVSVEETISKKRVDYGFRVDGIPKFFLEAKALKEEDIIQLKYVQQAIDYAWMKSCSWSVLTNFRTLVVYNSEENNKDPRMNRFLLFNDPKDYLENPDFLLLSRDSIKKGDLDKKAEQFGRKELKKPVDKALLDDITNFRELLYNSVKRNNPEKGLTEDDIEEAVQRIIDRLIFIRNAEDRELEPEELRSKVREWSNVGKNRLLAKLSDLYKQYDDNYNSKLFAHHLCDDLKIDDVIITVINGLYESKDGLYRYDFSVLSADVLGNIYEQYLGRILKKIGKTSKLEVSKAKRKSEGIYYTPTYIVDYIIKNTLGEYLKIHPERDVENVKVLDPACGSGSFLLKTYDTLESYWTYKGKIKDEKIDEDNKEVSYTRKTGIVKSDIFGVDLDEKAVEIAQLNLLLKIAEKRKRLPTLQKNIKNGNSLIDDPKMAGDKAFRWGEEFADIMKKGGFDIVVGNPPYFKIFENDPINKTEDYKEIKSGMMNASAVFINKSLKLIKDGGYLGMIVPKMLSFTDSWDKIRRKLLSEYKILCVIDCGKAFKGVLLEQVIFILKKVKPLNNDKIIIGELENNTIKETTNILQINCLLENKIPLEPNPVAYKIKKKMEDGNKRLGDVADIILGLGIQGKDFFFDEPRKGSKKVLRGDDIQRYIIRGCKFYDPDNKEIQKYKNTIENFNTPHIVAQRIVAHIKDHIKITAALDEEGLFSFNTVTNIFINDKTYSNEFILALLNSNAVQYYTYKFIYSNAIRSMDFYKAYAKNIPLPKLNVSSQEEISKLIRKLIDNIKIYYKEKMKQTDSINKLKEEILDLETKINDIIYSMYYLTENEKKIIEESLK